MEDLQRIIRYIQEYGTTISELTGAVVAHGGINTDDLPVNQERLTEWRLKQLGAGGGSVLLQAYSFMVDKHSDELF